MEVSAALVMRGLLIVANYNQEVEIRNVLERIARCVGRESTVVVDDGSTDRSADVAESMGFSVLRHGRNMGIGAAIRTGIRHAQANGFDYVTISSSNGKIQPEEVGIVSAAVASGEADYVQGSRFLAAGHSQDLTPFRRAAIPLFTLGASLILRRRFTDITCGFRSYKLDMFRDSRVDLDQPWLNRYEMEYYIHYWACRLRLRIKEVPVTIVYTHLQKGRKSKIVPIVGWWSMIRPFLFLALGIKR